MKPIFNPKTVGYCVEYYISTPNGNKFVGSEIVSEPDRTELGYYGTQYYKATEDVLINKGKCVIPKGADYHTRLIQLQGRDPKFYNNLIAISSSWTE